MEIPNRQTRKKQATKETLKDAFIELILKHGRIEPITTIQITTLADLNRGTFYIHFQDKYELLDALYEDAVDGLYRQYKMPYKERDELVMTGAAPFTKLILEQIERNQKLYKALDLIRMNPSLYDRLEEMLFTLFTEEILLVTEEPAELEYEIFLNFQLHATLGVIKYWIKKDFMYPIEFMSEQLTSFPIQRIVAIKKRN